MSQKKRNHFIPRVLLNRFCSRSEPQENKYWIWTFGPSTGAKEISTKDVAVSKYFYGKPASGLEDKFGDVEKQLGATFAAIDRGAPVQNFKEKLSNFAWIQAWRTRSIRSRVVNAFSDVLGGLRDSVDSNEARLSLIARNERLIDEKFQTIPAAQIAEMSRMLGGLQAVEYMKAQMRDAVHSGIFSREIQKMIQSILDFGSIDKSSDDIMNESLVQILDKDVSSPAIFNVDWELFEAGEGALMLSDSCLFSVAADGWVSPVVDAISWQTLVFPISSSKFLVGKKKPGEFSLNVEQINRASACCSVFQFFAPEAGKFSDLVPLIGSRIEMLRDGEKKQLLSSVWSKR